MVAKKQTKTTAKSRTAKSPKKGTATQKKTVKSTVVATKPRTIATRRKPAASKVSRKRSLLALKPIHKKISGGLVVLAVLAIAVTGMVNAFKSPISQAASNGTITGIAGKCLDNDRGIIASHNKIQLWSCNGSAAQKWDVMKDGTIRNQGYCLDVKSASKAARTLVQLYRCNGTVAQQWIVNADRSIVNPNSSLCLDDQWANTGNGNTIWMWPCNKTNAQQWSTAVDTVTPTPTPTPTPAPQPTPAPTPQPTPAPTPTPTKYLFNDEFNGANGSAPDPAKWVVFGGSSPSRWGEECFVNDRNHIKQDGQGHLVITATYNPGGVPCKNGSGPYESGGMNTGSATGGLFTYKYGTAEARIKVPCQSGTGMWPAWWADGPSWPRGGEIDYLEVMNNTGNPSYSASQTLHGGTTSGGSWQTPYTFKNNVPMCNDFHTYGAIWKKGQIQFTIDGKVTHTFTPATMPSGAVWPFDSYSERLLLDLQVGSWGGKVDNATLPQSMIVDYVRVY